MPYQTFKLIVQTGLAEVLLPFMLIFAITFGILQKTMVFGEENKKPKKNINATVAFSTALLVVGTANLLGIVKTAVFYLVIIIMAGVMIALVAGIGGTENKSKFVPAAVMALTVLFILFALGNAGVISKDKIWIIFVVALFVLWLINRTKGKNKQPKDDEKQVNKKKQAEGKKQIKEEKKKQIDEAKEYLKKLEKEVEKE